MGTGQQTQSVTVGGVAEEEEEELTYYYVT
jgi:hypothetical protein